MVTILLILAVVVLVMAAGLAAGVLMKSMGDGDIFGAWVSWNALEAVGKVLGIVLVALLGGDN